MALTLGPGVFFLSSPRSPVIQLSSNFVRTFKYIYEFELFSSFLKISVSTVRDNCVNLDAPMHSCTNDKIAWNLSSALLALLSLI